MPGFQCFFHFFHQFVLPKLATTSTRGKIAIKNLNMSVGPDFAAVSRFSYILCQQNLDDFI